MLTKISCVTKNGKTIYTKEEEKCNTISLTGKKIKDGNS